MNINKKHGITQRLSALGLALALAGLAGCAAQHPTPELSQAALVEAEQQSAAHAEQQAAFSPPPAVMDDLWAGLPQVPRIEAEPRFQLSARDVNAKEFFASLVADTPYSMAIHPEVSGNISLDLKDVTLDEVLGAVTDMYGYDIQRRGKIYHVYPAGMRIETFEVDYLTLQRQASSQIQVSTAQLSNSDNSGSSNSTFDSGSSGSGSSGSGSSQGSNVNGTQINSYSNSDFWLELQGVLEGLLGCQSSGGLGSNLAAGGQGGLFAAPALAPASSGCHSDGRSISVSPQAGLVTVRAMPSELRVIRDYLQTSQRHLQRQVVLEARILEVALNDGYQQGIQWEHLSSGSGTSQGQFGDTVSSVIGGLTTMVLEGSNFNATIDLLQSQGDVDVLSSPRVTALNNQKAVIKVGNDEYFVTDVSTTTVTGNATTSTPNLELTPFFSGVSLDVLPQIDKNGTVTMHVRPSVSKVNEQSKLIRVSDSEMTLPLALSELRETDTLVRAQSGEIVVIGGLMTTEKRESVSKVPVLGDIPVMGQLFQNKTESTEKLELVILIKPTVVETSTWQSEINQSRNNLQQWYPQLGSSF